MTSVASIGSQEIRRTYGTQCGKSACDARRDVLTAGSIPRGNSGGETSGRQVEKEVSFIIEHIRSGDTLT